jgi:hypothetical protein
MAPAGRMERSAGLPITGLPAVKLAAYGTGSPRRRTTVAAPGRRNRPRRSARPFRFPNLIRTAPTESSPICWPDQ